VPNRLFEREEPVLHLMGVQIASWKRRNPWTFEREGGGRSQQDSGGFLSGELRASEEADRGNVEAGAGR
jgi:hypothetical protein